MDITPSTGLTMAGLTLTTSAPGRQGRVAVRIDLRSARIGVLEAVAPPTASRLHPSAYLHPPIPSPLPLPCMHALRTFCPPLELFSLCMHREARMLYAARCMLCVACCWPPARRPLAWPQITASQVLVSGGSASIPQGSGGLGVLERRDVTERSARFARRRAPATPTAAPASAAPRHYTRVDRPLLVVFAGRLACSMNSSAADGARSWS